MAFSEWSGLNGIAALGGITGDVDSPLVSANEPAQDVEAPFGLRSQRTFPDYYNAPSLFEECDLVYGVTLPVQKELVLPKEGVCGRQTEVRTTLVPMPEAPLYEDHHAVLLDDNVRPTWQTSVVQAEPKTAGKKSPAHEDFRLGIPSADAAHHP